MNFGKKIFIMAFIIVIISIYIIGVCILSNNYKISLQEQIDKSIFQINTIYNSFILYENEKGISAIANQYLQDKIYVEVNWGNTLIYSNIREDITKMKEKLNSSKTTDIHVYIENQTIYARLNKNNVDIFMATDISKIYEDRDRQISFFIKLTIFFSIMIAFILSILVSFLTRKIKTLNHMAIEIEKGNYDITVPKLGTDEMGNLGRTFNNMTKSIKNNIKQINEVADNRKDFIHNLTHEIRTPLTSIIGYSSLIKNKKVIETQKIEEYAEKIYKEGIYIKEITDKLMEIILLEEQRQDTKKINISEVILTILEEFQDKFPNVKITNNITPNVYVKTDIILLKALMENLIKNAIKAYETEPIAVHIILDKNSIRIIDFGKGMSEQEKQKALQPFYTDKTDRNREFSGMGLGLPLCMKITKSFGWHLYIESEEGKGTKVIIEIGESHEKV